MLTDVTGGCEIIVVFFFTSYGLTFPQGLQNCVLLFKN